MTYLKIFSILLVVSVIAYACGSSEAATDKLAELDSLKSQLKEIKGKIASLEGELIASGELKPPGGNKILVSAITMEEKPFHHKVEFRGSVESRRNVVVSAEAAGKIESIAVSEGQSVSKGQLIARLDDELIRNSVEEVKTQLELATVLFERQANLWEQNIGTEVQYLQAKNNKESLERRLATLQSQHKMSKVYAPFAGTVDDLVVREGEMAQPGMPLVRLVNSQEMYLRADISEAFLGKFKVGDDVDVYFPSQDKRLTTSISAVGQVINNQNRTFEIEFQLPRVDFAVKPNQVVVLDMVDYMTDKALVVPSKIVQRDSRGNYVFELVQEEDKLVAKKVHIEAGVSYDQQTEVLTGLEVGQVIAFEGYRELAQDVVVEVGEN